MRIGSLFVGMLALVAGAAMAQGDTSLAPSIAPKVLAPHANLAPPPSPAPAGSHVLDKTDVDAWLDGYMPYALRSADIAGAVVTVVKDGQIVSARGFGYADIAKKQPVDPYRTLFRPGSVSKLLTWTAVMQLVEQGKLDLDRDVNAYLDFRIPPRDGQPITLRQIMTHTAGFEEAAKNDFLGKTSDLRPLGVFVKSWTPDRIYAPGTTPAYSNWATTLAGYIIERTSGMTFDDYVDAHIFAPLDMHYASFRQPLPAGIARYMATGYSRASEPAKPFEVVQVGPAGSLSASGVDMARFMIAHLDHGRGLLQPATADMMHDSPLDRVNPKSLIPPLNRMELGFFETNINGHEVIGHLGDTENFHTSLHLFTHDGVGFYVSFNSAGKEGAAHPLRISLFQDFADRYFPSTEHDGRVDAKTAAEHAKLMVGNWTDSRRATSSFLSVAYLLGQTKVTLDGNGALVIPNLKGVSGVPRKWVEIAPFVWREPGGHERLAAQVVDGKIVRWSADGESPFIVFDRVPLSQSSTWLLPLLYASLAVLALTFLYWPGSWFARRRHSVVLAVTGDARRAYRATRLMAGLDLAVLVGWIVLITALLSSVTGLTSGSDPWFWLMQVLGLIVFPGAVAIAGWNAWLTWQDGRHWTRKAWSLIVLLATVVVLYVAVTYKLIAMTVHY